LGIEPTDQKYIFGRFRQAKQAQTSYTGSGLGLSICKRLAELMNGDLSVASKTIEQPVGSCFKFQFECEMATDEQTKLFYEHQDLPKVHTRTTPLHVLVVEDNDINRRVMLKMLTSLNCTCEGAINGADGLVKYKKENWDLILMDVSMPVMNGLECTRRIREEEKITKKKVRIVGLSGNARQEHYEEAINSGMDAYLVKPVQKNDIALVIKDVE
jgi:CheY-like chemotaxis protein